MQISDVTRKLANVRHKIKELWTTFKAKIRDLGSRIYSSKPLLALRGIVHKLRRFRAFAWSERKFRKYKVQFWYMLAMLAVFGAALFMFALDLGKDYGYDKVAPANYEDVDWNGKYDNDGFTYSRQGDFKYKIVITPPNKSFIFKPSIDVAEVKMFIKDLRGSIQIPKGVTVIDQEGRTSTSRSIWTLSNQEKLTLIGRAHYTSLLGLSFVSPNQAATIAVNGQQFTTATIQVPEDATIIKYGDQFGANSYLLDERNVFFHSFSNPAVVYYQKNFHFYLQLVIIFALIVSTILIVFFKKINIKRIHFKNKHFIIFFLVIVGLMYLLSAVSPSPKKLVLSWGTTPTITKSEDYNAYPQFWLQRYLRWVLYLNQAVDVVVLGDVGGDCREDLNFRMGRYGIKKFIILEEQRSSSCAQSIINKYPSKVSIVPQSEVVNEIDSVKGKDYGYNKFIFKYTAGTIFLLSNMLLGLACMFLVWKAMNIKRLRDMLFFALYGFGSYYSIIIIYITVGWIARMPIGYHGSNSLGLIMSNYFLPGIISGGNNLRNFFAFLGILLILITSHKVFKLLNMRVYFIVISLLCLLMVIPNSEYHTKRFILSALSAEAYIWDYKQDVVNSLDMYRSIREANFVDYYKYVTNPLTYGNKDLAYASSLKSEGSWEESQQALKDIINKYQDLEQIQATAHLQLAELYYDQAKSKTSYNLSQGFINKDSYYHLALEEYLFFISNYPNDGNIPEAMDNSASIYTYFKQNDKAIKTYEAILSLFPKASFNNGIRQKLANLYILEGQNQDAIKIFVDIIDNNLTTDIIKAKFSLAETYIKTNNQSRALATLDQILHNEINNPQTLLNTIKILRNVKDYASSSDYNLVQRAIELEALGSIRHSLLEYANIENQIENEYLKSIVKYKIAYYLRSMSVDNVTGGEVGNVNTNNIIEAKINETLALSTNSSLKDNIKTLSINASSEATDTSQLKILINDEFNFEKIDKISEAGLSINSLSVIVSNQDNVCGNNVCEIGESDYDCGKDCVGNDPKITIRASSESGQGNNQTNLQLSINEEIIKQWPVNSSLSSDFKIPINFFSDEDKIIKLSNSKSGSRILVEQITINDETIEINRYIETQAPINFNNVKTTPVVESGPIQEQYDKVSLFLDRIFSKISPIEYNSFLRTKNISRGMMLYFTAVVGLLFVTFYSKTFRTVAISIFMLFLSRGILRVAEQDPFRAWVSMDPGVRLAVELTISLLIINAVLHVTTRTIKYAYLYIKKLRSR